MSINLETMKHLSEGLIKQKGAVKLNKFSKEDLQFGDIVITAGGIPYMVTEQGLYVDFNGIRYIPIEEYGDNMEHSIFRLNNIEKVYGLNENVFWRQIRKLSELKRLIKKPDTKLLYDRKNSMGF